MEKALGRLRLVINLLPPNTFMVLSKFRMETVLSVIVSIWEGDFVFKELKEACLQIAIHPESRCISVILGVQEDTPF